MIKFGWRKAEVMDAIMSEDDLIARLFKFDVNNDEMAEEEGFTCESCYCEYEPADVVTMPDCNHQLCSECFKVYLEMKINQGAECFKSKCPN